MKNPVSIAQVGWQYLNSLGSFALGGTPSPFSAAFCVTDRCNLDCSYCNFQSFASRELTLAEIDVLFKRLRKSGIKRLGITGGEPMMRRDLQQILTAAKQNKFFLTLNSNLVLDSRRNLDLREVDLVMTSLDGPVSTHIEKRGAKSYEGVLESIARIRAAGTRVVAICVIQSADITIVDRLLDDAENLGIQIHFQPLCMGSQIAKGTIDPDSSDAELRALWLYLAREKTRGRPIASSSLYLQFQQEWIDFRRSTIDSRNSMCAAGYGFIFIDPKGNASVCAYSRGKGQLINLLSEDWSQKWDRSTPCSKCNVGPMLEFNLLFQNPVRAAWHAVRTFS